MPSNPSDWIRQVDLDYHERQFREPYRSTVAFCDWVESLSLIDNASRIEVLDVACGLGGNIAYMAKRYPQCSFTGIDINDQLVQAGNRIFESAGIENCRLKTADLYRLNENFAGKFDAVISFQTLSWLPDFEAPLQSLCKLDAKWIALTSLFYDGPLSCKIEVQDYDPDFNPTEISFYNVYSLPLVEKRLESLGYSQISNTPFEIDIDLNPPADQGKGTYTKRLENGRRLQFSGPLHLPWKFIAASQ